MPAALTGLRADEVDADVERLRDVLRVADHLHACVSRQRDVVNQYSQRASGGMRGGLTFMTGMPAAWSLSMAHLGGTPTAQTKSLAFSSMMTSMSSGSWPLV